MVVLTKINRTLTLEVWIILRPPLDDPNCCIHMFCVICMSINLLHFVLYFAQSFFVGRAGVGSHEPCGSNGKFSDTVVSCVYIHLSYGYIYTYIHLSLSVCSHLGC